MTLHLASVRHLVGRKNPTLLHSILFSYDWSVVVDGKPKMKMRGWYVCPRTGKRIEAKPRIMDRFACTFTLAEERNKIRAELGAM